MRLVAAFLVSVLLLAPSVLAQTHTLHVDVTVNNTADDVYIPGEGVLPSASLANDTFEPEPYFIASYDSAAVLGLTGQASGSVTIGRSGSSHTIGVEQPLRGTVLLAFSPGDWKTVNNRMYMIKSGDFFRSITPSFSYGLGTEYVVRAVLHYPDIDIRGALQSSKGIYRLVIENKGVSGGRPVVEIKSA